MHLFALTIICFAFPADASVFVKRIRFKYCVFCCLVSWICFFYDALLIVVWFSLSNRFVNCYGVTCDNFLVLMY